MALEIIPVKIEEEIEPNTDIIDLVLESTVINDYDILIFSQKIISKNEGRIVDLSSVNPSLLASGIASSYGKDPRLVELILSESKRIVRMQENVIIVESNHGFVCANAGIDESNVRDGYVTMLPKDPDQSAAPIRSPFPGLDDPVRALQRRDKTKLRRGLDPFRKSSREPSR